MTHDGPARELRRVVERCRALPLARWDRPGPDGRTPAALVHDACSRLADLAADAEGRPRREVPRLRPHGVADQLTVLATDALAVADPDAVAQTLADLRRAL